MESIEAPLSHIYDIGFREGFNAVIQILQCSSAKELHPNQHYDRLFREVLTQTITVLEEALTELEPK